MAKPKIYTIGGDATLLHRALSNEARTVELAMMQRPRGSQTWEVLNAEHAVLMHMADQAQAMI